MGNWKKEITPGEKYLSKEKIQTGFILLDSLGPQLFVIAMITLNYILGIYTSGYKLTKLQNEINQFTYFWG